MMLRGCVLFILSSNSVAYLNLANVECGLNSVRMGRIVGGTEAVPSEIPWAASVWRLGVHQCGATVINQKWLLTAGHCICSALNTFFRIVQLTAVVGSNDLTDEAKMNFMTLARIVPYPDYKCESTRNDMALLETRDFLTWTEMLRPACLPQPNIVNFTGVEATVAGWGWTDEDRTKGSRPDVLRKVGVVVVDNQKCTSWYHSSGKNVVISETQMCAGFEEGGKDSCWADSGGPLMIADASGRLLVAGVVSTGHGCARRRLPGIYTRVSEFTNWIEETVRKK